MTDWESVYRSNFEMQAFSESKWTSKAMDLYESARKLEPEVLRVWESYRAQAQGQTTPPIKDHYHGPYFMMLAYAVENIFKAALVARNGPRYKIKFRQKREFPKEVKGHDLVTLAKLVNLSFDREEEDLLRRLTRSAVWFGRYPVPLRYKDISSSLTFSDGNKYLISWFGGNDIERLNKFLLSLPKRLGLNQRYLDNRLDGGVSA